MTHEEYRRRREFLEVALNDALDRGDYYLETDTLELLQKLDEKFDRKADTPSAEQEN